MNGRTFAARSDQACAGGVAVTAGASGARGGGGKGGFFFTCAGFRGSGFPPFALTASLMRLTRCFHFFRRSMIVRTCLLFERAISSPL